MDPEKGVFNSCNSWLLQLLAVVYCSGVRNCVCQIFTNLSNLKISKNDLVKWQITNSRAMLRLQY